MVVQSVAAITSRVAALSRFRLTEVKGLVRYDHLVGQVAV
jgi:hypothetical protein